MPPEEGAGASLAQTKTENGASAVGVAETQGSARISLPGYVKDNLGKEVYEDWSKRVEKDPEFAKRIPQTLPEFAKTWDSAQTELSTAIRRPKEGASKEEWNRFYKELGRPDSPKDYAFDRTELPKGMAYDQALEEAIAKAAHENGIPASALKAISKTLNETYATRYKTASEAKAKTDEERAAVQAKAIQAVLAERQKTWGEGFRERFARMNEVLSKFPKSVLERMTATGLSAEPAFIDFLDSYARATKNDRALGLRSEGEGEEAEEEETPKLKFEATRKRYPVRERAK